MRDGIWTFQANADTLRGTLANPSGVTWRNIRLVRITSSRASGGHQR